MCRVLRNSSGNQLWWCCHEPSPGCYSNFNDAYDHCPTKSVSKLDDYYYCCDKVPSFWTVFQGH